MATLKFADSHNMVAFLSKPAECEGFEQIVDFLNAHPIRYALTVNPTIYVSCIEQFWSSAVAKTINREVQLNALVDGKRIVITKTSVRRSLRLADAEGDISSRDEEDFGKDASKQGRRIHDTDADEDITLVNDDNKIFDVDALAGEEVFIAEQSKYIVEEVVNAAQTITTEEITFAQAPKELKSAKPKADKDKGKGIMIEEPVVEQTCKEKVEANVALTEEWDDIQAKVDVDYQLAERLQAEEQEQFTIEQKATLFKELLEQRRKHFAAKRHKDLKSKDFNYIKELFDKALKRVNMFVDFRTELVEGSSKRAGTELEQEVTKKQKVDDVQETAEVDNDQETDKIKELMKIVSDEVEVAIDAIPLAIKPPSIVDWKIHKEGKKSYYQIIRADGKSQMYLVFSHMLKSFNREDLENLWKLVKAKHGSTRPEEGYKRVI
ncbi:hypothetical protein Tco_0554468 [Tanacetum coccineum]